MISVCHITTVHPALDDRIFHKECLSLLAVGYKVNLVACHPCDEIIQGVHIHALKMGGSRFNRILKMFPAFRKAWATGSKVYHFHDPELMLIGVLLSLLGKKVIYDVHEDLSRQILYKEWIGIKNLRSIASVLVRWMESFCEIFFHRIMAATPDIAKNFSPKKTKLLRNFAIVSWIDTLAVAQIVDDSFVLIYVGGLNRERGIKEVISVLNRFSFSVKLWLLGPWDELYRKECEAMEGFKRVVYYGNKPLEEVYPYIKRADVGLSLLHPAKNYITSLPIKAFEYMTCSLPMIMSDFDYWKSTFAGCASFVNPYSKDQIVDAITFLKNNASVSKTYGSMGRKLVMNGYSWESESIVLLKAYDELTNGN